MNADEFRFAIFITVLVLVIFGSIGWSIFLGNRLYDKTQEERLITCLEHQDYQNCFNNIYGE